MKTIRSKLKFLTLGSMATVFMIVVLVSLYSLSRLSREFESLLQKVSGEQSDQMRQDSERVKDRFLTLYETIARKKGESMLDKDALVLKGAYLGNSYSGVSEYLAKTFEFDSEIALASFFVVEDGEAKAWAYFTKAFPQGLGLGFTYDAKSGSWSGLQNGKRVVVSDPGMSEVLETTDRKVHRAIMPVMDTTGREVQIPVLEVIVPINDGSLPSVEDYRKSGEPYAFLRYVISLEQVGRDLALEEQKLMEKLQEQTKRDQKNAEFVRSSMGSIRNQTVIILTITCIVLGLLAVFSTGFFANKLVEPLEHLAISADEIAQGQYSRKVEAQSEDEVGRLASTFDSMRVRVKEFTENLQELVAQKTAELQETVKIVTHQKQKIQLIMDRIGQGIIIVDNKLRIETEYSAFTESLFPDFARRLRSEGFQSIVITPSLLSDHDKNMAIQPLEFALGYNSFNWEANAVHLPTRISYASKDNRILTYELQWSPIIDAEDNVERVLVAIKDLTSQLALEETARREAEKMSELTFRLSETLKNPDKSAQVIMQGRSRLSELLKQSPIPGTHTLIELHTIKGNCRTVSLQKLSEIVHAAESNIKAAQDKGSLQGEVLREELSTVEREFSEYARLITDVLHMGPGHSEGQLMSALARDFDDLVKRARAEGIAIQTISCRDEVIDWNPGIIDGLVGALRHALTNAFDHGYLRPMREQGWKPSVVEFCVSASIQGGLARLDVIDRGFGLNYDKIRKMISAKGIPEEHLQDPVRLARILATEGLSTAASLSDTSGRGVGMTAIQHYAQSMGGELHVSPNVQGGMTLSLRLPLGKMVLGGVVPLMDMKRPA